MQRVTPHNTLLSGTLIIAVSSSDWTYIVWPPTRICTALRGTILLLHQITLVPAANLLTMESRCRSLRANSAHLNSLSGSMYVLVHSVSETFAAGGTLDRLARLSTGCLRWALGLLLQLNCEADLTVVYFDPRWSRFEVVEQP